MNLNVLMAVGAAIAFNLIAGQCLDEAGAWSTHPWLVAPWTLWCLASGWLAAAVGGRL